jgi:prephenate dehydrogenase
VKFQTVGLLGAGRFGKMVCQHLSGRIELRVFDNDPECLVGVPEACSLDAVLEADLIVLAVPISAVRGVCEDIAEHLKPGQVVVDTCSVKAKPVQWMLETLPTYVDVLGTHPLFGPDSGKEGIAGLKIAVCPARISREKVDIISGFLRTLELVVVEATPEEHDRQIALSQAIFHLIAQAMRRLDWGAKPISTPGPDSFFRLVKTVQRDTDQLFLDMERENPFATECRRQFIDEIMRIDSELKDQG